jgi:hypothetical protein
MTTFAIVFAAVATLFMAGLRAPRPPGRRALLVRWGLVLGAAGVALVANMALYKHDTHYDLTREQAFTPAEETLAVVRALDRDVELVYFYQQQSQAGPGGEGDGRAARADVGALARRRTVDPRLAIRASRTASA